ncbi:hypothetical protein PRIPAC_71012 [Pristionchus pacificus]|uniref:G protein-coupled receptor n=1 Tax=Pristionchus pacificus TaxID=54126 RepID=A0A2A6C0V7_PRIPA|nr:hypothetical protein PRIPAC_71012 [Pristionchus pacificus]|eukprot:PDM71749.1 G protein-coupled receptor [Pristionchus pacificus]
MELYPFLMISANVILIFSLPLLLRLLVILLKRSHYDTGLQSDFYRCITHILLVDLVYAVISILAVEPAAYGIFSEFYQANSSWISKIVIFQVSPLTKLSIYFHCIIALNRLTAMIFTLKHKYIWTPRVLRFLHFGGWFTTIFLSLPLIWPIQGSVVYVKSPFGSIGMSFVILGRIENVAYQAIPIVVGIILNTVILISYCIIVLKVRKHDELSSAVIRTTIASVLMCFSGWYLMLVRAVDSFYGHVLAKDLFSLEVYYSIFKIGHAVNGSVTSWITILMFRDIRSRVFSFCPRPQSTNIQPESGSDSSQRTVESSKIDHNYELGMEITMTRTWIGTEAYMSPEQQSVFSRMNSKTEMFSLGLIFVEMSLVMKDRNQKLEAKFIAKLTDQDPKKRPTCVEIMSDPFFLEASDIL